MPFIILSYATDYLDGTLFYLPSVSLEAHGKVFLKSLIVLSSWIAGYFSVKHLPLALIAIVLRFLWYPKRKNHTPFVWKGSIILISVFLAFADWIYFYALSFPDSMISIVSLIRRSNVLITFIVGDLFFHEKNLKNKAIDLFLVLLGMLFIYSGTK